MSKHDICLAWLKAVRATARQDGRRTDRGAAVLGDGFGGYTVEFPDATQVYVGRSHCKYCARAEAIASDPNPTKETS